MHIGCITIILIALGFSSNAIASASTLQFSPIAGQKSNSALGISEKNVRENINIIPIKWNWEDVSKKAETPRRIGDYKHGLLTLNGPQKNLTSISYIGNIPTRVDGMNDDEFKYWFEIHYYICAALLKATYPNWEKSRDWLASNFTEIIGAGSSASYASNGKVSKLSYLKNIRMITLSISTD